MSSGNQPRTRSDLVASVKLPPSIWVRGWRSLTQVDFWFRAGLCIAAVVIMWVISGGWAPRMVFRRGDIPHRDIVARTDFQVVDDQQTQRARERAAETMLCVYRHDPEILTQLKHALYDKIFQIVRAESLDEVEPGLWAEFSTLPSLRTGGADALAAALGGWSSGLVTGVSLGAPQGVVGWDQLRRLEFQAFRQAFADEPRIQRFQQAIDAALATFERDGLLDTLQHDLYKGSQTEIQVYPRGTPGDLHRVYVQDVLLGDAAGRLRERLEKNIESPIVAASVHGWLQGRLSATLMLDVDATRAEEERVVQRVPDVMVTYKTSDVLARAGTALGDARLDLLRAEHQQLVRQMGWTHRIRYGLAKIGMYVALFALCGTYLYFRFPAILQDDKTLLRIIGLTVITALAAHLAADGVFQAELVPLVLFSMTVVIVYQQELAILLSATMALLVVLALRLDLAHLVIYFATMAAAVLMLRRIRHRTKLLYVGLVAGLVGMSTALGVRAMETPAFGAEWSDPILLGHIKQAVWSGFHAVIAGLLMTGLLPFIEKIFDAQTELSLLELGDVAHPLLQELVRRAPGTFNHSMNVASMAEAAAEAIGASGLLVRVGAYFHDIGKMLKPSYFVENQPRHQNRHDSLLPAMSTLIIIAHVKDGADLARQHNLPRSIIDLIRQHHGTTLVEYFYQRASEQSEAEPGGGKVEEGTYRYPGPKPRTKEAAVLMMADAVESAGRSLTDPTPAKIEGLVHDLALKRLLDGQFDECGLTLKELRMIEVSLIKSLSAVCHGRIRYPDQVTA